ncbi:MAG: hypothetical protein A2W91_09150 [Bacteroidetes bacterium GWF2_38_335]|nr:MAG: hypothetical protein A2W91_09150 [Bacteroidetes bacterium GWF2_38_335]OFY80538.1 MAG: hypothetical protein A2281_08875 [Bacteroidetes bacterium RIFOXYA12_FULL_38_20]HBS85851.1 hypothetical protein [Bacteroidales bacterium]
MFSKYHLYFIFIIFLISAGIADAQVTKIRGRITDATTGEPLPYVNIVFKKKTVGTITDFNGYYKLETATPGDSIIISYLGYQTVSKPVIKGRYQEINVALVSSDVMLQEVLVYKNKKRMKNRDNPAITLLDKVVDNRPENDILKMDHYQYEVYTKIQFDINNISDKFMNRRVLKPFKFVFDYIDTSAVNGKTYLPVFIIESLADYYYKKSPMTEKEILKATKISGVDNESVQQFLADMYVDIDIYANNIDLFSKGFVNPVSSLGKAYYKYFLIDSMTIDNQWCYEIAFLPKFKEDLLFDGNFWVTDTSFAVKKIELKVNEKANLNFINNIEITKEFQQIDTMWVLSKETFLADFNAFENPDEAMGFFGKRTSMYKNYVINVPAPEEIFKGPEKLQILEEANERDDKFWDESRHEQLSEKEATIYKMVDTIKSLPAFRTYYDIINMFVTGYFVRGKIEIGPYFSMYSFNPIEGNRFRFGGRTSNKFSTKFMPEAYVAYGTLDEKFKYGGKLLYMVDKDPRKALGANYKYDMEQLGQSVNAFREDNIMSSMLRRNPNNKLSMVQETKLYYDHEWFHGLSNSLSLVNRKMYPAGMSDFKLNYYNDTTLRNTIITSDIVLNTRFAYNEAFYMGEFERVSLGSYYPVVNLYLTLGMQDILNSDFSYKKIELSVEHFKNIYPIGYIKYLLEAGKVFGTLPYPLLKMHEGNETYAFDMYSFNMMNYYEFVSDQYVSLYLSHYFEGFFLNKLPLFKKLQWREIIWGKGVIGTLSDKNRQLMDFPETLNAFEKNSNGFPTPYLEAGAGIENIFRLLRVDAVWRFTYLDHPNVSRFGIRLSLWLQF